MPAQVSTYSSDYEEHGATKLPDKKELQVIQPLICMDMDFERVIF